MPLVHYETLDQVPEPFRNIAVEKNGKIEVDLAPAKSVRDLQAANATVSTERDSLKVIAEKVKAIAGEDDLDAFGNKVREWQETAQKVADGTLTASDKIEAEVAKRLTTVKDGYERQLGEERREKAAWKSRADSTTEHARSLRIEKDVQLAAIDPKIGVEPSALPDVVERAKRIFTVDENGDLVAKDGSVKLYGADGTTPLTVEEWLATQLKTSAPHFFKGSKGGGGGDGDRRGAGRGLYLGKHTKAEWDAFAPETKMRMHREAGSPKNVIY